MDSKTYRRMTNATMRGWTVEALVPLRNAYVEVPVGTKLTIVSKRGGLELVAFPCASCGHKARFTKVHPGLVHLLVTSQDNSGAKPEPDPK